MTQSKVTRVGVGARIRVRVSQIIAEAVDAGVCLGWHRAWKHCDGTPGEDDATETIARAVMEQLDELLIYDEVER